MGCVSSKADSDNQQSRPAAQAGNKADAGGGGGGGGAGGGGGQQQLDPRLPFTNYRDAYSLKNYWKSVRRKENFGKHVLLKFLKDSPDHREKFQLLSKANLDNESALFENNEFETVAGNYFRIFDEVMTEIENNPGNMDSAVDTLTSAGKKYKRSPEYTLASFKAMEEPFLYNVRDVLQDRYNEKCDSLFRNFFKFSMKYLEQGFTEG